MKPSLRRSLAGIAFTLPWIIGLCTFTLYPVIASLYYSFCDYSVLESPVWIGGDNYSRLVHDRNFWISLKNTLIYAGFSIPIGMIVALCLALLLNCRVRGTAIFRTIFYSHPSCPSSPVPCSGSGFSIPAWAWSIRRSRLSAISSACTRPAGWTIRRGPSRR
jgi:ABC-type sugar transport system permease subunit